jgi:hypothetical protein
MIFSPLEDDHALAQIVIRAGAKLVGMVCVVEDI